MGTSYSWGGPQAPAVLTTSSVSLTLSRVDLLDLHVVDIYSRHDEESEEDRHEARSLFLHECGRLSTICSGVMVISSDRVDN